MVLYQRLQVHLRRMHGLDLGHFPRCTVGTSVHNQSTIRKDVPGPGSERINGERINGLPFLP